MGSHTERPRPPKSARRGRTVAQILIPYLKASGADTRRESLWYAGKAFIASNGSKHPTDLRTTDVLEAFAACSGFQQGTRYAWTVDFRRILRFLFEEHGAARLWEAVPRVQVPPPRAVTVTSEERARILSACDKSMRCWILLCSDLAIRSGTAALIAPRNFDPEANTITFRTKFGTNQTLPLTAELAAMFRSLPRDADATKPYVAHFSRLGRIGINPLRKKLRDMLVTLGIQKQITPHDLRRTTAVRMYQLTGDLRSVQALLGHSDLSTTLYYLDHRTTPVDLSALELAKLPPATERTQ